MDATWEGVLDQLQQPAGCDFTLDSCQIPGLATLPRSALEIFRQVLSMYYSMCALIASNADAVADVSFARWSEDARAILVSSELAEHQQPFRPVAKKGHVAD